MGKRTGFGCQHRIKKNSRSWRSGAFYAGRVKDYRPAFRHGRIQYEHENEDKDGCRHFDDDISARADGVPKTQEKCFANGSAPGCRCCSLCIIC